LRLFDDVLDAARVDAAVGDELLEGDARRLAADRVEAGEDDGLGRVVDDDVDAGRLLERADVPPLAADDAALHLVGGQRDDGDGRLGGVVGGDALDGEGDDLLRLALGVAAGLLLDLADPLRGGGARLLLELVHQLPLGLVGAEAGERLEPLLHLAVAAVEIAPRARFDFSAR
jgi:hypothetical protein